MTEPVSPSPTLPPPEATPPRAADAPPPSWAAERESLYEMLAHQQRVAQMGLVASGLAHDVMNHLTGIVGAAQLAQCSRDPAAPHEALETVIKRCREAAETTRALLGFVKRRDQAPGGTFAVAASVATALRLVGPLARARGVPITSQIEAEPSVRGDGQLLVQALVNLASNAVRACAPVQGAVEIVVALQPDGQARVDVSDTGPGIPEAVRGRLFRPFETTHGASGGNGIGLFVVRQSVRRLGGTLRTRTSSKGTRFTLLLPALAAGTPAPSLPSRAARGTPLPATSAPARPVPTAP